MRQIDGDELIVKINDYFDKCEKRGIAPAIFGVIRHIKAMPTIDQWHYPSRGELPEKDGEYLCRYYKYNLRFSRVLRYRVKDNKWYKLYYDEEYRAPKPDAWQYIIPPEEDA